MTTDTEEKKPIALLFEAKKESWGTLRLNISVVEYHNGEIRNPPSMGSYWPNREFCGLTCTAFPDDEGKLIGWEYVYREIYSIDAETAELMAKTLRHIEKRMKALAQKFGHPQTFAQYVIHFSNAIGTQTFLKRRNGKSGFYSENEYMEGDAESLIHWVNVALDDYTKKES